MIASKLSTLSYKVIIFYYASKMVTYIPQFSMLLLNVVTSSSNTRAGNANAGTVAVVAVLFSYQAIVYEIEEKFPPKAG